MVAISKKPPRQTNPNNSRNRPEWNPPNQPDAPLPGLVPKGSEGIYTTPGGAVSPFDCGRWPDSPFCGGNPFTDEPIGLNFSRVEDECNIGIQVAPVLGFVKLPLHQVVYRKPGECRLPPPKPRPNPGISNYDERVPIPKGSYFTYPAYSYQYEDGMSNLYSGLPVALFEASSSASVLKVEFLQNSNIILTGGYRPNVLIQFQVSRTYRANVAWALEFNNFQGVNDFVVARGGDPIDSTEDIYAEWNVEWSGVVNYYASYAPVPPYVTDTYSGTLAPFLFNTVKFILSDGKDTVRKKRETYRANYNFYNRNSALFPIEIPSSFEPRVISIDEIIEDFYGLLYRGEGYTIEVEELVSTFHPLEQLDIPPPPPDNRKCKCMCCDDSLLRALYAKVSQLYDAVGVDDYPVSVPQWITKNNSPQISIDNLTRFVSYTIKQLDSISGNYPIKIKIKDADLTQQGDQSQTITIPNAAEAMAEILGILLTVRTETNAALVASINGMIEAGSAKQLAFLAQEYAAANAEFLAYKGKQVERELPFSFTPNEPEIEKMLTPKNVKVKGWENDDKNDFFDAIAPLLELAAMWKAQNFRKTGAASPVETLSDLLRGANDIGGLMQNLRKNPPQKPNEDGSTPPSPTVPDDWDTFINDAETGFIAKAGITDNTHPYNRPLDQRPRIREIGDDTSDTND